LLNSEQNKGEIDHPETTAKKKPKLKKNISKNELQIGPGSYEIDQFFKEENTEISN
jgi:hypothetical protein